MIKLKRIISYILLICLVTLLFNNETFANEVNANTSSFSLMENSEVSLYGIDDSIVAYYYTLSNGGYIIVESDGTDFIEYSLEENSGYIDSDEHYYYFGPLSCYTRLNDNSFINVKSKEIVEEKDLNIFLTKSKGITKPNKAEVNAKQVIKAEQISNYFSTSQATLPYPTFEWSLNTNGTCGSLASAILLAYYKKNVDGNYIPSNLYSTNGIALHNLLISIIEPNLEGSDYESITNGINTYLNNQENILFSHSASYLYGLNSGIVFSKFTEYISNIQQPVILGVTSHPTYEEHWVVGTGYLSITILGLPIRVAICNDGWGSQNIRINFAYIDGCVYIN
jgi:hypothetical protein